MLNYIAVFSFFAVAAFSVNTNSGVNSKYLLYPFTASTAGTTTYFPFAIKGSNVCQPGFFENLGYSFACSADGNYVTIKTYGSTTCTGSATTTVINSTSYGYDTTVSPYNTYLGAFNCTGSDEYALINFEASDAVCTSGTGYISIYAAINKCLRVPNILNYAIQNYSNLNIWCNYESAELQYFSINDTTCSTTIEKYYNATGKCGFMFAFGGTTDVYGYVVNCTQNTTGGAKSSSDANIISYGMGLMISIFVAILNK